MSQNHFGVDATFPTSPELVDNALLLASLSNLSAPHFLSPVITSATVHTRKRLVIVLFSRLFNTTERTNLSLGFSGVSHTERWDEVQRLLTFVYVHAVKAAQDTGKMLMEIDVLLKGLNEDLDESLGATMDIVFRVAGDACPVPLPSSISFLRQSYIPAGERHPEFQTVVDGTHTPSFPPKPFFYPVVALGGTFDHLHAGHKILLSMAAWITQEKLIVGMTDDALLKNKANRHVMEDFARRTERVRDFLTLFKAGLVYDITTINDVYGPTGWDPNIQALVVSKETLSGASAIATYRQAHNLPPLETYVVDVISSTSPSLDHEDAEWLKKAKLSSTVIREWIVKQGAQDSGGKQVKAL